MAASLGLLVSFKTSSELLDAHSHLRQGSEFEAIDYAAMPALGSRKWPAIRAR